MIRSLRTLVRPLASAGVGNQPGQTDGYRPALPAGASAADTAASREPTTVVAADAVAAPPGCTCGGQGVCLHCFFAEADTLEQKMMATALAATERALAREVTS